MTDISHGPITCDRCWKGITATVQERGPFKLVRDPGHWGAINPSLLVLGISKGNTQSRAFAAGEFDTVAFKGIRDRLLQVLQTVGLLPCETPDQFEQRFRSDEKCLAFASVVRCSLTGQNRKPTGPTHTAESPFVIPAFRPGSEGYTFVSACVDKHIGHLPEATRTVILLGNATSYIKAVRDLFGRTLGGARVINGVSYQARSALFVHVAHPSRGNGHFGSFIRGEGGSGAKMRLAAEALRSWPPAAEAWTT